MLALDIEVEKEHMMPEDQISVFFNMRHVARIIFEERDSLQVFTVIK